MEFLLCTFKKIRKVFSQILQKTPIEENTLLIVLESCHLELWWDCFYMVLIMFFFFSA